MAGKLLLRGMLAGVIAALIAFVFARLAGEPLVTSAIAIEQRSGHTTSLQNDAARSEAHAHQHHHEEAASDDVVNRETQSGAGLLVALVGFGAAIGGLFSLVFAVIYGRIWKVDATTLSLFLALGGFIALVLVPALKYPPNPPAVGNPETIGARTAWFFIAIAVSVALLVVALRFYSGWRLKLGNTMAALLSIAMYVATAAVLFTAMPTIDEVPNGFPATLLWDFRLTAWGLQLLMWMSLGLAFSWLSHRANMKQRLFGRNVRS
ncbi:membrane protein [Caballeronia fortuita]|uniref:Membrane protein n=1 Tax=Caballeronia fortuita TaxID=1777138 RepID=A0A158CU36_9BURK|nr:CbtA family protein [Caballeronia fortuita]SAK85416.1 membrane protein [Caballeronia fortuita]